jgi:hypothetical protein
MRLWKPQRMETRNRDFAVVRFHLGLLGFPLVSGSFPYLQREKGASFPVRFSVVSSSLISFPVSMPIHGK